MQDVGIEGQLAKELEQTFAKTADHMRNQEGDMGGGSPFLKNLIA